MMMMVVKVAHKAALCFTTCNVRSIDQIGIKFGTN